MTKILGIDLGTNSIGLAVRDTEKGINLKEQLDFITSVIFKSGVGSGKSGEFSYAAERTKKRSTRRLYQSRKYRIWETLAVLIENGYCPLNNEDLEKWSKYDKEKGLKRQYPVNVEKFEQWVRLDFNGDGIADYTSPYQLREELMNRQFDFSIETERYKFGRALYHIAQRRGFKSSKGETIQEQEKDSKKELIDDFDVTLALKKSEEKNSKDLVAYMKTYNIPTVGCAFARLEREGVRVRGSNYQAVRSQYKDEIKQIFEFQNGLNTDSDFYKRIVSEKKGEGTIFYKRPLRSQKGLVGLCTLEPNKPRCAISHPDFEKFRAWSFINNIQYRNDVSSEWKDLTLEQKSKLYNDKFLRAKNNFDFFEIREWIENTILNSDGIHNYKLIYDNDKKKRTINYKDNTNVSACPISARLKNILGENWENAIIKSQKERIDKKTGASHIVTYTAEDLWHVCFSFDEVEYVEEFAKNDLQFDEKKIKQMAVLWGAISQGYSMLSLKAIRNINRFLQRGMIYTNAVLLAKLPDIFGEDWEKYEKDIVESLDEVIRDNNKQRVFYTMANTLIANYKSINYTDRFAEHDQTYLLQQNDYDGVEGLTKGIKNVVSEYYGEQTWKSKSEEEQQDIIKEVATLYQQFFASSNRDYFKIPKVAEALANYLITNFPFLDSNTVIKKIYHPSMIDFYKPAKCNAQGFKLLGSPVIGALKNPMAMRVLHNLRKQINELILSGTIDEDTKIVVETARELNDANMRWAIAEYQKQRESENKEIEKRLQEYKKTSANIGSEDIEKAKLLLDQFNIDNEERGSDVQLNSQFKKDVTKYKLWLEQGCKCIYTGKIINLTSLLGDDNLVDFEHTIPRSISFDNSLSNLTVCDAHFNRSIKKNQIPSQLSNYQEILTRIKPWMDKVVALKDNVEYWKKQSKRAATKDRKDQCIRQRHLWEMELEYWQKKVNAFTITEVSSGFRNNQLVDTRIITKYAYHYLKTVFNKVEVQKGSVTADFRKMLGIQSLDEKKSRDKHSHHAIDATMLTLVPSSSQRDKMLQLFYEKIENKDNAYYSKALQDEIKKCGFGSIQGVDEFIENNILINHIQKDQVLTPAHKRMRIRNKVVWKRDSDGNIIRDEKGNPIPKRWITGDCIRGQLHGDSFYGAITKAQTEGNTLLRNEDGSIKIEEQVYYVKRRELKYKANSQDSGFSNWDELEKSIVNKDLIPMMKSQFSEGTSFKDACMQGIYMLDKKGNKVAKIRHVRCYTSIKNPLVIKKQTYLSDKPYKQNYYAEVGDLYVMCRYQNDSFKSLYQPYNMFDIVQNRQLNDCDIPQTIENKGCIYKLQQILRKGDMLLIYKDSVEELKGMENSILSQRLYVIEGFETGGNLIVMRKHINAQASSSLGKGESIKDFSKMPERIRCGINTLHFLVKDTDFKMSSNGIVFL